MHDIKPKSNKYVTDNLGHYSFGKQYQYTANLSNHRLYARSDYDSIKDELFEYYKLTNQDDESMLLRTQLETIQTLRYHLQSVLETFINGSEVKDDLLFDLWCWPDDFSDIKQFVYSEFEFLLNKSHQKSKAVSSKNKEKDEKKTELNPLVPLVFINYQHLFEATSRLFCS
eukprot:318785_1